MRLSLRSDGLFICLPALHLQQKIAVFDVGLFSFEFSPSPAGTGPSQIFQALLLKVTSRNGLRACTTTEKAGCKETWTG